MSAIPETMRALVAPKYCDPSGYEVIELPVPKIKRPHDVLLRMHAVIFGTGECQYARGMPLMRIVATATFPMKLGREGSGVVVAVGPAVTTVKVGDAVYGGAYMWPFFRDGDPGWCAEYAVAEEQLLLHKPAHLSFEDVAGVLGDVTTAVQAGRRAVELLGGGATLEGKTVYVPGALSGTGSAAVQVLKNQLGAAKIIATVSTPKLPLVDQLLPGLVDQVIDYTVTPRLEDVIPKGSVDLVYNTQWTTLVPAIPLINRDRGAVISLTGVPRSILIKRLLNTPWWLNWLVDAMQYYYTYLFWGTNIKFEMISGTPHIREDMETAGELVALGKVKMVTTVVKFNDVEEMKKGLQFVNTGKGGIGRLVIKIV